ncbi:FAD-dependent oxidoreductase [Streptomyces sp. NPDC001822]|uniref:FAD-dependent oxidoreductase n=1 Tax=Streptomyces sp. NPDC001822 TaxID=3364614 RepID=UPI0036B8EFA8
MAESPVAVFDRLVRQDAPESTPVLFDTACVLGGSVAGLLAARVLADYAREVLVIERDETNVTGRPRPGVPHDRQAHALLPGGLALMERWLPGITGEMRDDGGVLVTADAMDLIVDGVEQLRTGDAHTLLCSRPFLESALRRRVLALPNVSAITAEVTGLVYRDDAVSSVRYMEEGDAEDILPVDFVVDAMGRSSSLSDWLDEAGYSRPHQQRLQTGIHYATVVFGGDGTDRDRRFTALQYPRFAGPGGLAAGLVVPIENDQWMISLLVYGGNKPPGSVEEFRALCDKLPAPFGRAAGGVVVRDVLRYRQATSRRRDFVGLRRFPARLVSVGDAAVSLNAKYAQGVSSAALHAACLSDYLADAPDPALPADRFFASQKVATDAVWVPSADADAVRADILQAIEVSDELQRQRAATEQLMRAALTDATVAEAHRAVRFMFAHPDTLADPALLERAAAVNQGAGSPS